jgi:flagellar biosynthesis protein FlhG
MPTHSSEHRWKAIDASAAPQRRKAGQRLVVVSGGKPGVGATTLAVNLAATFASEALRVVLVDANLHGAGLAAQCGISAALGIHDVLSGQKTIHEALQRGAAGMQVLAGNTQPDSRGSVNERSLQRLLRQMRSLEPYVDWLIVDAGNHPTDLAAQLWLIAEVVLLVTTPEAVAVMDTYALIKTLLARHSLPSPIELIVNQVDGAIGAADVHRRIDQSCRRFLGMSLNLAGEIPSSKRAALAARQGSPAALSDSPDSWTQAIISIANRVTAAPRAAISAAKVA